MTRLIKLFVCPIICLATALIPTAVAPNATAHSASFASAEAKIDRSGQLELKVRFDLLAFVLHQSPSHSSHAATDRFFTASDETIGDILIEAKTRFSDALRVRCGDATASIFEVEFPMVQDLREIQRRSNNSHHSLMVDVTVHGRVPESAEQVAFGFSSSFDQLVLTVDRPGEAFHVESLDPGGMSSTLTLNMDAPLPPKLAGDAAMMSSEPLIADPELKQNLPDHYSLTSMLIHPVGIVSTIICVTIMTMLIWIFIIRQQIDLLQRFHNNKLNQRPD